MKKLLIISYYFFPDISIAANRFTKIAKYLKLDYEYPIDLVCNGSKISLDVLSWKISELGYINEVYYLTENPLKKTFRLLKTKVKSFDTKNYITKNNNKSNIISLIEEALSHLNYLIELIFDYFEYLKFIRSNSNDFSTYDVVISTYGPTINHLIAKKLKKRNKNLYWIADYRDPILNSQTPRLLKNYASRLHNRLTIDADHIVAVSNGCLRNLNNTNEKFSIIRNGFDSSETNCKYLRNRNDLSEINLFYAGTLYQNLSDLSPIFKVLNRLSCNEAFKDYSINFIYSGQSERTFLEQLFYTEPLFKYELLGNVSKEKVYEKYLVSDFAVITSWSNSLDRGIITGKFFEITGFNIPYIVLMNGCEYDNDNELHELVVNSGGGKMFWYNYDEAKMVEEIYKYLHSIFINKTKVVDFNNNYISQFSYQEIAKRFQKIIN